MRLQTVAIMGAIYILFIHVSYVCTYDYSCRVHWAAQILAHFRHFLATLRRFAKKSRHPDSAR